MEGLFFIILAGILADAIVKIVKHRAAGIPLLRGELEDLRNQLEDQANRLNDAQALLASQDAQLQELHERLDFTERMLTQGRDRPGLGAGPAPGQ